MSCDERLQVEHNDDTCCCFTLILMIKFDAGLCSEVAILEQF